VAKVGIDLRIFHGNQEDDVGISSDGFRSSRKETRDNA
jgi:hypothetical protein